MQGLYVNKKLEYILSLVILASSILIIFAPTDAIRYICAAFVGIAALLAFLLIKKRAIPSYNKRMILMLMAVFGIVYLSLYYLSGTYFEFGTVLGDNLFINIVGYALPIAVAIVASELLRFVFLSQGDRISTLAVYLICIFTDVSMQGGVGAIRDFGGFMGMLALTVFPSVIAHLLYHYISLRYGMLPNIAYRLITTLYLYIIPVRPSMPDAIFAFINLITPIVIYVFIDTLYGKKRRYALQRRTPVGTVFTMLGIVVAALFVMLISCQFKYGAIVIATESMTGEIDKGDAIIYESYERGDVEVGEVIVFEKDGVRVVHRVIREIEENGETRYYTKGDANNTQDPGYITKGDIRGKVIYKVPHVGYPTIWIREIVSDIID